MKCDTAQSVIAEQDAIVEELKAVDDARRTSGIVRASS